MDFFQTGGVGGIDWFGEGAETIQGGCQTFRKYLFQGENSYLIIPIFYIFIIFHIFFNKSKVRKLVANISDIAK